MSKKILPIAIDLGAKNTAVFTGFYDKGTRLEDLNNKQGKVYELTKDSYTLLMSSRTANKHQRRGLDRRQLVKRLFRLIWTEKLNLHWDKDAQQSISFLLNRRGFSFLEEKHDASYFEKFPKEAIKILPKKLRLDFNSGDEYDLNNIIIETVENNTFKEVYDEIYNNVKQVKGCIVKYNYIDYIKNAIDQKISTGTIERTKKNKLDKLEKVSLWVIDDIFDSSISVNIETVDNYYKNVFSYLDLLSNDRLNSLKNNLPTIDINEYKNSVWNFNISEFNLDNVKLIEKLEAGDVSTHLHHLGYALENIRKELDSGGRHRSKYFEEVENVLSKQDHEEPYLEKFCKNLHSDQYANLNAKKLVNLIGNLSNLELKPLRKYFNDKAHAKADYWSEKRFAKIYCRWILGEWRVGSKDKDKKDDADYSYKDLCNDLKNKVGTTHNIKASIIDFFLELEPCRTIPPYQDNNNRRPPKCQSLILNPKFLDAKYPQWQSWLHELRGLESVQEYLEDFEDELKNLKTGKGQSYFVESKSVNKQIASGQRDYKDLDARVLQFIFDRVKASDDLKLNEIYSYAKKVKQKSSSDGEKSEYSGKLETAIQDSELPSILKSQHTGGIFKHDTFLHLVCKYYKYRQRARDSRLYIMPEYYHDKKLDKYNNTGRFDDDNQLLTYCNHKPRQKRYQLLNDLAGVLQVSPNFLVEKVGSNDELKIIDWLKKFKIASYCATAVEMQKKHRGTLKNVMQTAVFKKRLEQIKKNKKASEDEKALLEKYKNAKPLTTDEKVLANLVDNIIKSSKKIGEALGLNNSEIDKFSSIFSFAQIQQIAFAERNGNAKTCAVCSADNAHRMQTTLSQSESSQQSSAKAQRLSAIPTRVIDGAVKKMATILARNIVDDNWHNIKQTLSDKQELHIPIITESNAFEFEPSLDEIKNIKKKKKDRKSSQELFAVKENRIKQFAKGISAYSGDKLSSGNFKGSEEELDHIIPRSREYGTLNDEANLICVTPKDNKDKGNQIYDLSKLANSYKRKQFATTDNSKIKNWIAEKIWDGEKGTFKFGNYRSFINLSVEERVAFRHALFLDDNNPVRQAVINAINNRNRAFVNGTQRYFAEVLANNIYLRAKKENLATEKLSFDYFGVATTNSNGEGIADIRKLYEAVDSDIESYAKGDKLQDSYSHLIDAMLAFCIAADEHKNDGSIGLEVDKTYSLYPLDKDTGEVFTKDIFSQIKVADSQFSEEKLARRKATDGFNTHRQMTRDGIYAENYLPILIHKELDEVKKGFTWENSEILKTHKGKKYDTQQLNNLVYSLRFMSKPIILDTQINSLDEFREILKENNIKSTVEYFYINLKTQKLHEYYTNNYNTALGYKKYSNQMSFLRGLAYRTERVRIESLEQVSNILAKDSNFKIGEINLPLKKEWQNLKYEWQNSDIKDKDEFLKSYFEFKFNTKQHKKVRKYFSLPVITREGKFLVKRKSWNNDFTYQILNNSDPRTNGVQAFVPVYSHITKGRQKGIIDSFLSNNIFMLSNDSFVKAMDKDITIIDRLSWYSIELTDELLDFGVTGISYRIDDNTRPSIKISYIDICNDNISKLCDNPLLKPNTLKDFKTQLESYSSYQDFVYKGSTFTETVNIVLNESLRKAYETPNN